MLKGFQKKYLKGLAHGLDPVVFVGQRGLTESFARAMEEALNAHELIKVRFVDYKEKAQKERIASRIESDHGCERVGMIGHVAIFYRKHHDPEKQKISVPERSR